jgi:hypothetical protein
MRCEDRGGADGKASLVSGTTRAARQDCGETVRGKGSVTLLCLLPTHGRASPLAPPTNGVRRTGPKPLRQRRVEPVTPFRKPGNHGPKRWTSRRGNTEAYTPHPSSLTGAKEKL